MFIKARLVKVLVVWCAVESDADRYCTSQLPVGVTAVAAITPRKQCCLVRMVCRLGLKLPHLAKGVAWLEWYAGLNLETTRMKGSRLVRRLVA